MHRALTTSRFYDLTICKDATRFAHNQMGVTPVMSDKIENVCPGSLRPYPRNARTHSKKQVRQIAKSIRRFGFTAPVLIDRANMILAGHGRVAQPSTSVWRRCRAGASRR
jgi:hypothetical protein